MLRRIPKVLLLVALLTALVASSIPAFGRHCTPLNFCIGSALATNCGFVNGKCHTEKCKKGEPCGFSICACFSF